MGSDWSANIVPFSEVLRNSGNNPLARLDPAGWTLEGGGEQCLYCLTRGQAGGHVKFNYFSWGCFLEFPGCWRVGGVDGILLDFMTSGADFMTSGADFGTSATFIMLNPFFLC